MSLLGKERLKINNFSTREKKPWGFDRKMGKIPKHIKKKANDL